MGRRYRFVEFGVVVAIAAATATAIGLAPSANAVGGSANASTYVPIVPCRLADTRSAPNTVGERATPLRAAEVVAFQVWGSNGDCTIPATATAIVANATAVNPTADSFVTLFPSDANPRPTASNLNVVAGAPPTPNQVTVTLSATGAASAFNNGGTLDLVIDIAGYYESAASYTKAEIDAAQAATNAALAQLDAALATKATTPSGARVWRFTGIGFVPRDSDIFQVDQQGVVTLSGIGGCAYARLDLPDGSVVTSLVSRLSDESSTGQAELTLAYSEGTGDFTSMAQFATGSSATPGASTTMTDSSIVDPTIDNQTRSYFLRFCGSNTSTHLRSGVINYTLP